MGGLAAFAVMWACEDRIRDVRYFGTRPLPRMGYFLSSTIGGIGGFAGWVAVTLSAKWSGLCGWILALPVLLSVATAVALCALLTSIALEPWARQFSHMLVFLGAPMAGVMVVVIHRSHT
ncbi:MAG: hypothetical protein GY842_12285 [bacterium]|nr:hypothetical protein [bacterium]